MALRHCEMCDRAVQTRRKIGVGTLLLVLCTGGLWILAILFYRQRCPICWGAEFGALRSGPMKRLADDRRRRELTLAGIVAVMIVIAYLANRT